MFNKGEMVVYGQTGVCVIEDVCEKELIRNQKRLYYVLKPCFQQNNVIYAPADSDRVFIRPVITKQQADELILSIPKITEKMTKGEMTQQDYRAELATHDCKDLVELTAKIYEKEESANANGKKLGFADEKYMKLAENLLFGELSVALDIPYDEVKGYITRKLKK